jgi:hypothetical protein
MTNGIYTIKNWQHTSGGMYVRNNTAEIPYRIASEESQKYKGDLTGGGEVA